MLHVCTLHDGQFMWDSEQDPAECPVCALIEDHFCEIDHLQEHLAETVAKLAAKHQALQSFQARAQKAEDEVERLRRLA
jgi:hypothetical protein